MRTDGKQLDLTGACKPGAVILVDHERRLSKLEKPKPKDRQPTDEAILLATIDVRLKDLVTALARVAELLARAA